MAPMNAQEFSQMLEDVKALERKYDMVLVPIFEEDAIASLYEAVVQDGDGEAIENTVIGLVKSAWTADHFKDDIRTAYATDEPLRKVLFNKFRFDLVGWAIGEDATELPRQSSK